MMEVLFTSGEILLRAVSSVIILFLLTKLMGKRQISQLTFFDYTIGISIGSIAAEMASNVDTPFYATLISMVVYTAISILIAFITEKSIRGRRFFTGEPSILIYKGKIVENALQKQHFDLNELLSECRNSGYFNISDVEYAVMETNGKISFLPKSEKRPLTPQDMNLSPQQEGLVYMVVIDGKAMPENLRSVGRNEDWLNKKLQEQGVDKVSDVLLATLDQEDNLSVYSKGVKLPKHSPFE